MTKNSDLVSKHVLAFLKEHGGDEDAWKAKQNQEQLKSLVGGLKTKDRKTKDPNKPKRGKSSYLFFCMDERPKVAKEHPNMGAKEITSELGLRWGKLKEKDQKAVKKYEKMADADKERYAKEMEAYASGGDAEPAPAPEPAKKKEKASKPKGKKKK